MAEIMRPEVYPDLGEFKVIRNLVTNAFNRVSSGRDDNPSAWKPFDSSTAMGLTIHSVFVEEVVISALPHNIKMTTELIGSWHENGVTPDQLKAYGEIAAGVCCELGRAEEGWMMRAYIDDVVDTTWPDNGSLQERWSDDGRAA